MSVVWGSLCVVLTLLYALQLNDVVNNVCLSAVALGSIGCILLGPSLHRPAAMTPWRLLALAALLLLVSVVIRPGNIPSEPTHGLRTMIPDLVALTGYAFMIASLIQLNRAGGPMERNALADGIIVSLGVGLLATILLALPTTEVAGRPYTVSLLAGLYPVIDVVLLQLMVNLAFSTAIRLPSYRWLGLAGLLMLIGDVGYAWLNAGDRTTAQPMMNLPYLLAYACFGLAAFHPSMAQISVAVPRPIQAWSRLRMLFIGPALMIPAVLTAVMPQHGLVARLVIGAVYAGMVLALLYRAISAVRGLDRVQVELRHRAGHDALTDLPNRNELTDRLRRLRADEQAGLPIWVLFLDLDGFKLINDSWGHEIGDQLLLEVAGRLRELVGALGEVARIGGDEFVIGGRMSTTQATALAERIRLGLREPYLIAGLQLGVTTSIGLTDGTAGDDAAGLLRDADAAMYRAKDLGRDGWKIFDDEMRESMQVRRELELALRSAVARDQLWVAYQPIVDLDTERVVGAEALLRWAHPDRGVIGPEEFIPIAEEIGVILEIGAWVLARSLRQTAEWVQRGVVGPEFFISVNASTSQLRDFRLGELAADLFVETGLAPSRLILEITESVMMERSQQANDVLMALRELGVRLSVDDFGTGFSSLSYLSRYPVTGVKVDRSFIDGLGTVPGDEAIVRAVAALASALKLGVVAEGVETAPQRDILRGMGIRQGQGQLWGRAVDPDRFAGQLLAEAASRTRT
jgi:diguanylate cyclase (GGDEF)-like protein